MFTQKSDCVAVFIFSMNDYAEKTGFLEKMEHQELLEEGSLRTAEGLDPANRPTEPGLNRTEPYSPTAAATERLLNPWSEEPSEGGEQTTLNYHRGGKGGVVSVWAWPLGVTCRLVSCCCCTSVCFTSTLLMLCSIAYFLACRENPESI